MDEQALALELYRALRAVIHGAGQRKLGFRPHVAAQGGAVSVDAVDVGLIFKHVPMAEGAALVEAVKLVANTPPDNAPALGGTQQEGRPDPKVETA